MIEMYDETDQTRIQWLTSRLVQGQLSRGEIPHTAESIKAATLKSLLDAQQVINTTRKYFSL